MFKVDFILTQHIHEFHSFLGVRNPSKHKDDAGKFTTFSIFLCSLLDVLFQLALFIRFIATIENKQMPLNHVLKRNSKIAG